MRSNYHKYWSPLEVNKKIIMVSGSWNEMFPCSPVQQSAELVKLPVCGHPSMIKHIFRSYKS